MKTKHLFFLGCITLCAPAYAQNIIKRQAIAGGSGNDYLVNICLTSNKEDMLTAGYSNSDSNQYKRQNSRGGYDYYVIKTPVNNMQPKVPEWSRTIGGAGDDILVAAVATQDGGFLLGGYSNSGKSGEKSGNNQGLNDYWLVKLNAKGKIEWDKTIGDSLDNILQSLDETTDGGFILAGHSKISTFFSKYTLTKTDSQGNVLWVQTPDSVSYFYSVQHTNDNGFILSALSNYEVSLLKGDSLGNIQWLKHIIGRYYDDVFAAKQTADGGYITYGTHALSRCESCGYDYEYVNEITKTDKQGTILWNHSDNIYGDYAFPPVALEETKDHHYLFGTSAADGVYFLQKVDDAGNLNWTYLVGNTFNNDYHFADIKEIKPNRYVLGGYTFKGIDGIKTQPNLGGVDYWDIQMIDTTGQSTNVAKTMIATAQTVIKSNNHFSIYPNPAKDVIHIQVNGNAIITFTNSSGKILLSKSINNSDAINVSNYANGVYYLQNKTTGETQKIIIIH